jgi:ATP-dependent DNA ligase
MKFESYRYIYPPRPKNPVSPKDLDFWDNGSLLSQAKLNGSNTLIFSDKTTFRVMNRHNQPLSNFKIKSEVESLLSKMDGHSVINGEYLNKGKLDQFGNRFVDKLVIFDILVKESQYLIGSTVQERVNIMNESFNPQESKWEYIDQVSENIFMVKSYTDGFSDLFDKVTKIDMMEGLVLKRKSAKLEMGTTEDNNSKWMIKSRKPHKNYKY